MNIITVLAAKKYRATKPRLAVFGALEQASQPVSINEIVHACPETDRVSVYRTLELFTMLNVVSKTMYGWKPRYELAEPFRLHHHHIQCTHCGCVRDVASQRLETLFAELAEKQGFSLKSHIFELNGVCKNCKNV